MNNETYTWVPIAEAIGRLEDKTKYLCLLDAVDNETQLRWCKDAGFENLSGHYIYEDRRILGVLLPSISADEISESKLNELAEEEIEKIILETDKSIGNVFAKDGGINPLSKRLARNISLRLSLSNQPASGSKLNAVDGVEFAWWAFKNLYRPMIAKKGTWANLCSEKEFTHSELEGIYQKEALGLSLSKQPIEESPIKQIFTVAEAAKFHGRSKRAIWDKIKEQNLGKVEGYKHILMREEVIGMKFRAENTSLSSVKDKQEEHRTFTTKQVIELLKKQRRECFDVATTFKREDVSVDELYSYIMRSKEPILDKQEETRDNDRISQLKQEERCNGCGWPLSIHNESKACKQEEEKKPLSENNDVTDEDIAFAQMNEDEREQYLKSLPEEKINDNDLPF